MFSFSLEDSQNILPVVQGKRKTKDAEIQTEHLVNESKSTQLPEKKTVKVQTSLSAKPKASSAEYDPDALLGFLNRVTPDVCSTLDKNSSSHAFDHYKFLSDMDATATHKLHSLRSKLPSNEFLCADVSWNSTGSVLAVAYGSRNHSDWCKHDSVIALWNVHRKDFNCEKPNVVIETDCCMTSIGFHPDVPPLLAGGKFNGDVCIWNIAKEDDMLMASTESVYNAHREPITGLIWSPQDNKKLISSSRDGKILVWKYLEKKSALELEHGFIILAESVTRSLGIKSIRPDAEVGVMSMSLNSENPSIFVIGTEGGGIFQCSFDSKVAAPFSLSQSVPLKLPITVHFQKHCAHTTSVQFSPFSRNIFLSSSSDGELRIYSMLQAKPVITFNLPVGIQRACWSLVRPLVLAALTDDGFLHMFDIHLDQVNAVESFPLEDDNSRGSSLCFNKENTHLLGTGCSTGSAQVWKLRSSFQTAESYEDKELRALSSLD